MVVGVRHAKVENPDNVVYARLPGFHLAEEGRRAAEDLARRLSTAPVVAVAASPLERAMETARILAAPHGIEVLTEERLLEWSFWTHWQGLAWSRIRERDPELLTAYAEDPAAASPDAPLDRAGRDVLEWAEEADREHPEGLVLGVTHEAPLIAATLIGREGSVARYHHHDLPHLATVRLRPGPPEVVDLVEWAATC